MTGGSDRFCARCSGNLGYSELYRSGDSCKSAQISQVLHANVRDGWTAEHEDSLGDVIGNVDGFEALASCF